MICQLGIALRFVEPPIWRRFRVPHEIRLDRLHQVIQVVMGWPDRHFHLFSRPETSYGTPDEDMPFPVLPEWRYTLAQVVSGPGDRFVYEYDFGDGWSHEVVVESIAPPGAGEPPVACLEGARACPPDGVVAHGGYAQFLEAIRDASHPRHAELLAWAGGWHDPEAFDVAEVNRRLAASGLAMEGADG